MPTRLIGLAVVLTLSLAVAPLIGEAQQAGKVRTVGVLETASVTARDLTGWSAFHQRLRELGYAEGQNIAFEMRAADGKNERLRGLAAELTALRVDIIVTLGTPAAVAAKEATSTIPIVMAVVGEPVGAGLIASLGRPGGNVTGLSNLDAELSGNRLETLKAAVPALSRVAVLDPFSSLSCTSGINLAGASESRSMSQSLNHSGQRWDFVVACTCTPSSRATREQPVRRTSERHNSYVAGSHSRLR